MLISLIDKLFLAYTILLFARILGSWVPEFQNTRAMMFIAFYTDPYLNIFRKIIPPLGMFDLSPIVAFLFLSFAQRILKAILIMIFL